MCEPSYFWATSLRYQRRIVSGVTMPDDVRQAASAENAAFHGQAASLVVGEAQPSGSVRGAEDPVLLEQVVNDRLLLPVNPARDQQEQEGERARQRVHGGSLSQRATRFKVRRLISWRSDTIFRNFAPGRVFAQHGGRAWLLRVWRLWRLEVPAGPPASAPSAVVRCRSPACPSPKPGDSRWTVRMIGAANGTTAFGPIELRPSARRPSNAFRRCHGTSPVADLHARLPT